MKALKYGLTLILGLSMLGFNARVQAQMAAQQNNELRIPAQIGDFVDQQAYAKAMVEFEKFIKTVQSNPCESFRLSLMFYNDLLQVDTTKTAFYQEKVDSYTNQYLQSCGNTAYAYLLKNARMESQDFDSTVVWMTKAIALNSTDAYLYHVRGYALWQLQRTEEACVDYKKAKELDEFYADYYDTQCVKPEESAEAPAPVAE